LLIVAGEARDCNGQVYEHLKRVPVWPPADAAIIYLVTCCTASRQKILANAQAHEAICAAWQHLGDWRSGRYVVMPDHVHFFIAPLACDASLPKCVQGFRSFVSKTLRPVGYP
jgi:hypothetical protein